MMSFADRAAAPAHVLVRFLDRESVLLNLETERYFGLDETGTRMWQLATDSPSLNAAYQQLLAEFDVEPEPADFPNSPANCCDDAPTRGRNSERPEGNCSEWPEGLPVRVVHPPSACATMGPWNSSQISQTHSRTRSTRPPRQWSRSKAGGVPRADSCSPTASC